MIEIVNLYTSRDDYGIREVAECSMTVRELIDELEHFSDNAKIVFNNDNGYTYGIIRSDSLESDFYETREEEERREKMDELKEELEDLKDRYQNPGDYIDEDEEPMTAEQYEENKQSLFKEYGITEEEYNSYK